MAFAINKKARKRERRQAKLSLAVADKLERERGASVEWVAMIRDNAANRIKRSLRKKRRRVKARISN
jgi:hypothetical protein